MNISISKIEAAKKLFDAALDMLGIASLTENERKTFTKAANTASRLMVDQLSGLTPAHGDIKVTDDKTDDIPY